jgi:hypothetical protein
MEMEKKASSASALTYGVLMAMVLLAVGFTYAHLPAVTTNVILFAIATVMALLVVFQYMGIKMEGVLIYATIITPLVLFALLVFVLIPDISIHHTLMPNP